jgi:hypothetical protein
VLVQEELQGLQELALRGGGTGRSLSAGRQKKNMFVKVF